MTETDRMLDGTWFRRRKATADTRRKIQGWETWECEDAGFTHDYDRRVTLFVEAGSAVLTFADGECVEIQAGDTLTIGEGASAAWTIAHPIRNRYCYHDSFTSFEGRMGQIYWYENLA